MQISVRHGELLSAGASLLVLGMYGEGAFDSPVLKTVYDALGSKLKKRAKAQSFTGKPGQSLLIPAPAEAHADYLLIVGLGPLDSLPLSSVREAAGSALSSAKRLGLDTIAFELLGEGHDDFDAKRSAAAITEALLLGDYSYNVYKKKKGIEVKTVELIAQEKRSVLKAEKGVVHGTDVIAGVNLARDLVNTPAQDMTPTVLAEEARRIAKESGGRIKCKVLDREQCRKKKMGSYLAVAQGSEEPPQFIHLTYKPEKESKKRLALVGKGVTFDSGGLSLKPSKGMETMKCDMAGSAAVIGAFEAIRRLLPKIEVHGIVAATENMPSDRAIRPGDVVRASNGKTIEILNTDAEGRLTLADAIHYAGKQKPDAIVDLATLTGACVVSLGEEIAAVMSNDDKFAQDMLVASSTAGEKMWHMPLEVNYRKLIESDIADVRNISTSRYGGSLTAGLFLKEFVPEDVPWVHLDIAGPAFAERPMASYLGKGGTGYGVRTLLKLIETF